MDRPHVVAANDAGNAPDPAVDDIVIEWFVARAEESAEQIVYRFVTEADHRILRLSRDVDGVASVRVVLYGHPEDLLGGVEAVSGWNSMWTAPSILALSDVVMSLVW